MDLEPANGAVVHQAAADDLQGLLERGFGGELLIRRNYGDWLRVVAEERDRFRLEYYEAPSGRVFRAEEPCPWNIVKDAVEDYFAGHWNWHRVATWRAV